MGGGSLRYGKGVDGGKPWNAWNGQAHCAHDEGPTDRKTVEVDYVRSDPKLWTGVKIEQAAAAAANGRPPQNGRKRTMNEIVFEGAHFRFAFKQNNLYISILYVFLEKSLLALCSLQFGLIIRNCEVDLRNFPIVSNVSSVIFTYE